MRDDPASSPTGIHLPDPIDWIALFGRSATPDWIIPGFLVKGHQLHIHASRKMGKSLLMLYIAASLANGKNPMTGETRKPCRVVYLDYEMTGLDVLSRITTMGFAPERLGNLKYYLFPTLRPFDTARGAQELMALVERDHAEIVVMDTLARVVEGGENDNDTYRALYRHTGTQLKHRGVSLVRLDHEGHSSGRSRGASAKSDDVDAVWQLKHRKSSFTLKLTATRTNWYPAEITLHKFDEPLRFMTSEEPPSDEVAEKVRVLDDLNVPLDATRTDAISLMQAAGLVAGRTETLGSALRLRKQRAVNQTGTAGNTPGNTPAASEGTVEGTNPETQ